MPHDKKNCRYLLGSLSDYVDGTAEDEICAEIERHLEDCQNCRIVVDTLKRTVYLVHAAAEKAEPELPDEVRARLFKVLDLDDYLIDHS